MGPLNNTAGDLNRNRKLSSEKVRQIRDLFSKGETLTELAKRFGVHRQTIYQVVRRLRWQSVE